MSRMILYGHRSLVLLLIACCSLQGIVVPRATSAATGARLMVFISDLHMGVGKIDGTDEWHRTEDFRWADEFELFLRFIDEQGQGRIDLIIVGDFLELWQSLELECTGEKDQRECRVKDCLYGNFDLGCNESEALNRLNRILSQHAKVFWDLGAFSTAGDNRLVIIPGNHDAALLYPSVRQAMLKAIPAPDGRTRIAEEGYWLSADGRIMAEHGHQLDQVNLFDKWPSPFLREGSQIHLRRPWGEQFVQDYYNQYEERFPIIDNISEEGLGVRLGIAAGDAAKAVEAVGRFFQFILYQVSWDQFRSFLGETGGPPLWDIESIRYNEGVRFLVESIPANDPMRTLAEKAFRAGSLKVAPANLTDAELEALCDQRAAFAEQLNKPGESPLITECPRADGTLGAISDYLFRTPDTILKDYLERTYEVLQRARPEITPFDVFVYGHTHKANRGFQPVKGYWNPTVVNTGAFQRVVTPDQLKAIQEKRALKDKEALLFLKPEDLPACYSYIRIDPYEDRPRPLLRYWVQDESGKWGEKEQCD
jgi:UDP-2,3-diacylglucosamine pyrophosphatase LpxH